jgi:hypothetical protein
VREALFRALEKHHSGGADALNAAGVFPDGMADPGALVVLKSLPRQRPPRTDDDDKPAPLDSWSAATQLLVQNYVSKLGGMSQGGGKMTANPKGFPIRAHRGGEFEYTGLLKLSPAANAPAGTGISETRIYYARTSFAPAKERERKDALEHYRSMGGAIQRADTARGTMWMDGVKAGGSGMRRTVDVLIRSGGAAGGMGGIGGAPGGLGEAGGLSGPPGLPGLPGGGGPGGGGAGQNYTIEIVMIEIADPRGGSALQILLPQALTEFKDKRGKRLREMSQEVRTPEPQQLPRVLGLFDATMIVVGSIIGSGIFLKVSSIDSQLAPYGVLAILGTWLFVGLITLCGSLALAELGAMFPNAGGPYLYIRESFGQLPAFLWGGRNSGWSAPDQLERWPVRRCFTSTSLYR